LEKPVEDFLKIVLAVSRLVDNRTGIDPLLSRSIYDYGVQDPGWNWLEIDRTIERVSNSLPSLPPQRSAFTGDFLEAFRIMVREGMGESVPYQERVQAYLQVSAEPVLQSTIDALRNELQQKLITCGYADELLTAYRQWSQDCKIAPEDLYQAGQEILDLARQRTNELVLADPQEHQIELNFPNNYPYNGYSDYSRGYRGRIFLNGDVQYTLPGLKHLICHEALPGHQLFSALREELYGRGVMPVEGTVYLANTPISAIVEGNCEVGQQMLGMDDTADDEIYDLYNRYASAISTNLAIACNADGMDQETAVHFLMEQVFISNEEAVRRHAFFTNPLWHTSFPHYWFGREMMRSNFARMKEYLPEYYRMVYQEAHTVLTLGERIDQFLELKKIN